VTNTLRACIALLTLSIAIPGCAKQDGAGDGASKSGLAWTPVNYKDMSENCKRALACCEAFAKDGGAKTAEDYNLKCSGPALWKDGECAADMKMRVDMLEGKPVPDACK
jgi:hypothetical protein